MPDQRLRSPARLLAPLALVAFALALFVVLGASRGTEDDKKSPAASSSESTPAKAPDTPPKPKRKRTSYTVKVGDSLGAIAEKTGVEVETLELLNPGVDAQALSPGQKLKLQE